MYQDHGIYLYYTLNGKSPLVFGPSLVATEEDVEYVLDSFDKTLAKGLNRLLTTFIKEKVTSRWA
jgi:hypothetical protein